MKHLLAVSLRCGISEKNVHDLRDLCHRQENQINVHDGYLKKFERKVTNKDDLYERVLEDKELMEIE